MYNVSGIIYRIWALFGIFFLIGVIILLGEEPWRKKSKPREILIAIAFIALGIGGALVNVYRINNLDVGEYTGVFQYSHRDSSQTPPLPFTFRYTFKRGQEKKENFYLDTFSKREIFPPPTKDLEKEETYTVYYEKHTRTILKIVKEETT